MKIRFSVVLSALLLTVASVSGWAQDFPKPPHITAREFALMAWGASPSNPRQLALMRRAGLNISGFCSPDDLAAVHAAKMSCFVTDSRVNGYDLTNMPSENVLHQKVTSLIEEVKGHPAALGFFLYDEPRANMFPGLAQEVAMLRHAAPGAVTYINLLANYAMPERMGAPTYEAYLQKFMDEVHPSLLSYDDYSLFNGKMLGRFYTNLGSVRRLALKNGIPFWNVILSNTHFTYMDPTAATLRLQAYSTMAYGGRGIEYFTYYAPNAANFRLAPIDQFGHRTQTWYLLRHLNDQIRELAPWLSKLHSTGVYHSTPLPKGAKPIADSPLVKQILAATYQNPPVPAEYLIGEFKNAQGHSFLMIVNKSLKYSIRYAIRLKQAKEYLVEISPYTGKVLPAKIEVSWLAPGAGTLFEVK